MQLSSDQVLALAPDSSSAAAGKKLANVRHWQNLGQSAEAAWGECQGSALYQVRVELATFTVKCTCPSHKFPCKHGLGLLLLATDANSVPTAEPPDWVKEWLSKRASTSARKQEKQEQQEQEKPGKTTGDGDTLTSDQRKRLQKRETLIARGLDTLDLWMNDLMRNGLASVEAQPATYWEHQAAQLVDAQAAGIAGRVRHLAGVTGSRPDWPDVLLGQLGRIALLTHAYRHSDTLDAALREDVRQLIGWNVEKEDLADTGEKVSDQWDVLGQWEYDDDKLRVQKTWLLGRASRRPTLILQFSAMGRPYAETFLPGTRLTGDLYFYPGVSRLRGHLANRQANTTAIADIAMGYATIAEFLASQAELLGRLPWQETFLVALHGATPVCTNDQGWYIRDQNGAALPLRGSGHWRLLAVSGGQPVDFAGEWDGETVLPLGMTAEGVYHPLWRVS